MAYSIFFQAHDWIMKQIKVCIFALNFDNKRPLKGDEFLHLKIITPPPKTSDGSGMTATFDFRSWTYIYIYEYNVHVRLFRCVAK